MALQGIATTLLLPPLLLVLLSLAGAVVLLVSGRRRPRRGVALLVLAAALGQLLLATPYVSAALRVSLQRTLPAATPGTAPGAIVILSAEVARSEDGVDIGPLTLERVRTGAELARRTGLPVLVTGGYIGVGEPPLAALMADALQRDFGLGVRWVEPRAADTAGNARFSAEMLRADGIAAAYVVTHAWHLPRALEAFSRTGLAAVPAPVRLDRAPEGVASDWIPRADHLAQSWFAIREWLGILVYRLRDVPPSSGGASRGGERQ
jgi:uncharacterized SAM-binding protein YcdF (DUF218 family)